MPNKPMKVYTFANTLAAAGNTNTEKRVVCTKSVTFVYTIASINTNVDIAIQVSADGTNFGIDPLRPVVQHTANGTYAQTFVGAAPYVSLVFVAESGGTDVVITIRGAFSPY